MARNLCGKPFGSYCGNAYIVNTVFLSSSYERE